MRDSILLSIIIPVFNMKDYLGKCIESLDRQNFGKDVEIIFIDDGSVDNSGIILDEYADGRDNIYVYHQENGGVAAARNKGLEKSRGEYIGWIDPDDYITDDWWRTIKFELVSKPDMVYFDMYMLDKSELLEMNFDRSSRDLSRSELCESLALDKMKSHLWSKIILRKFFDRYFSTEYSYCEDYALMHYVCWNVNCCKYIHKPLYVYRQLENSITHNEEKLLDNFRIGIRLSKIRYRFYSRRGVNVSKIGVYLSMWNYCVHYSQMKLLSVEPYKKICSLCLAILTRNFMELLFSSQISWREKLKICCMGFSLIVRMKSVTIIKS